MKLMTSKDVRSSGPVPDAAMPAKHLAKRPYLPPKLERLGTIADLTQGLGNNNTFDGSHPPGQNKSIL
jgi:hypothetical protein